METRVPVEWIRGQLACFEEQTRGHSHARGDKTLFGLENKIQLCLQLHEMIKGAQRSWGERVASKELAYSEAEAENIQSLYIYWLRLAKPLFTRVKRAEVAGHQLAVFETLRDTIGFCYEARVNIREVNRTIAKLESGEGLVRITEGSHGVRHRRAG